MRLTSWIALLAILLAAVLSGAAAADDAPSMSLSVEPNEVSVGDLFTVTVTVEHAEGVTVNLPGADADLGSAEVRSAQRSVERLPNGRRRLTVIYRATLWEVGETTVQAPPASWRSASGEAHEFDRPEAVVTVRSVLPEGADDIRPIRPPHEMPLRAIHYVLAALPILLLLALIAGAIVWIRRRRSRAEAEQAPEPVLPPAEEALNALDELEEENLVGRTLLKEHYVRLSWILRRYIERRWHLAALEETTGMLRRSMKGSGRVDDDIADRIATVLRRADLAKFAKHRPEHAVARADLDEVRQIVTMTRAREESQEEPDAGTERALAS